jgi:lipoprotein-releasing system permease protein
VPTLLLLNAGVLLLCLLMLLLPSHIISRISPVRAIKFE